MNEQKLEEKEIFSVFKTLNLLSKSEREKILSQGLVQPKIEEKVIQFVILDNSSEEKKKDARLE